MTSNATISACYLRHPWWRRSGRCGAQPDGSKSGG